ncbi:ACATN protein, partial [Polypterus senegalus]
MKTSNCNNVQGFEEQEKINLLQDPDNEILHSVPRSCKGLKGELGNISLLLFLYVLQGIPLGLAGSIPLILQILTVTFPSYEQIGFSAADAVTGLKLVEEGVPKEQLALLAVPMVPLQILLPLIISKYTAGPRPLDIFYKAFPFRLLMGLEFALLVWWTPNVKQDGGFPAYYYLVVLLSYAIHQVAVYSMYVAIMAFHAKVSDPVIGGTYMTLLNTVTNLGGNWPSTLALWLVDPLTVKECIGAEGQSCGSSEEIALCTKLGGSCLTTLDGYYVESGICIIIGFVWWFWLGKKMRHLQEEKQSAWQCRITK